MAILDRDVSALVEMLGGGLTSPYQYQRVAEAMLELDLPDDALRWALDGIERTSGCRWQRSTTSPPNSSPNGVT